MFFVLGNALLDASIAVWDAKRFYDYVRPISAVRFLFAGRKIDAWAGPTRYQTRSSCLPAPRAGIFAANGSNRSSNS